MAGESGPDLSEFIELLLYPQAYEASAGEEMEASGGRTGRAGELDLWGDERGLSRDWGRSGSSGAALPESPEAEEARWGDELRTFDGVLKDSSKGFGSR